MNATLIKSLMVLLTLGTLCAAAPAEAASSGPYSMDVLINGVPAREYYARGTTYIEAKQAREYTLRLTNHTGSRVAVALAVDGLNSIDAKHTSAYDARKWILGPYESMEVRGWQTSGSTSRAFYFTSEGGSYGAWMGDTRNLGNISAAFFQEEVSRPRAIYQPPPTYREYGNEELSMLDGATGEATRREAPAAAAPQAESRGMAKSAPSGSAGRMAAPAEKDELAATGIGREQHNAVYSVHFKHGRNPSAVVTVRYEYRPKLVELGILPPPVYRPDPMVRRERSSGFAPDPYYRR
ncbi:MAG: hypothetical protein ACKO6N_20780 [Myxococcota bacterium]